MPRKLTPPPALAAVIANHAARAAGDGRAYHADSAPLPPGEDVTEYGLELGRAYVINADGTLTPTLQPASRNTTSAPSRMTREDAEVLKAARPRGLGR